MEFETYQPEDADDIDLDSMTDAEIDEITDKIVQDCAELAGAMDSLPQMTDPKRLLQLLYTYKILKAAYKDTAKVTLEINQPFSFTGSVSILGKNIMIHKKAFLLASKLASNVELYSSSKGVININFTFNDLTRLIEQ